MTGGAGRRGRPDRAGADAQAARRGRRADHRRVPTSPKRYRAAHRCRPGVALWHRDRLDEAQRALREVPGVTVLIYDQHCAAEARRLRKRGTSADPHHPRRHQRGGVRGLRRLRREVATACRCSRSTPSSAARRRIDQTSCNTDYSLPGRRLPVVRDGRAAGDDAGARRRGRELRREPPAGARRRASRADARDVFLAGIGGTGIVTVNQVLGSAALRDGLRGRTASTRPGCRQKAGPVVSHLRIGRDADRASDRPAGRRGGLLPRLRPARRRPTPQNLGYARPGAHGRRRVDQPRTPTGSWSRDPRRGRTPTCPALLERIARPQPRGRRARRAGRRRGAVRRRHAGQPAARRRGVPVRCAAASRRPAIEWAIELNGVAVAANTAGVPVGSGGGRRPGRVRRAPSGRRPSAPTRSLRPSSLVGELATGRPAGWRDCAPRSWSTTRTRARARAYVDDVGGLAAPSGRLGERHRVLRGGRAGAAQAHRVQGRVRGGAAAHRPGVRGRGWPPRCRAARG